jgi:hypothetical protein
MSDRAKAIGKVETLRSVIKKANQKMSDPSKNNGWVNNLKQVIKKAK